MKKSIKIIITFGMVFIFSSCATLNKAQGELHYNNSISKGQELQDLKKALDEGAINQEEFNLMKGNTEEDYSLYASHSIWESREHFINWTKSEAFRLAHKNAGQHAEIYMGPPKLETFEKAV